MKDRVGGIARDADSRRGNEHARKEGDEEEMMGFRPHGDSGENGGQKVAEEEPEKGWYGL